MKTEDIIIVLDNANSLRLEAQPALREYVLDKSVPLGDRFKAWVRHCDKRHRQSMDIDFVDKLEKMKLFIPPAPGKYDWRDFIDSGFEIKELIIEENFGSLIVL